MLSSFIHSLIHSTHADVGLPVCRHHAWNWATMVAEPATVLVLVEPAGETDSFITLGKVPGVSVLEKQAPSPSFSQLHSSPPVPRPTWHVRAPMCQLKRQVRAKGIALSRTALCDFKGRPHPLSYLALSRMGWRDRPGEAGCQKVCFNPEKILGETGRSLWLQTWV